MNKPSIDRRRPRMDETTAALDTPSRLVMPINRLRLEYHMAARWGAFAMQRGCRFGGRRHRLSEAFAERVARVRRIWWAISPPPLSREWLTQCACIAAYGLQRAAARAELARCETAMALIADALVAAGHPDPSHTPPGFEFTIMPTTLNALRGAWLQYRFSKGSDTVDHFWIADDVKWS